MVAAAAATLAGLAPRSAAASPASASLSSRPAAAGTPSGPAAGADAATTPLVRPARLAPHVPAGAVALGAVSASAPVTVEVALAPSDPAGLAALASAQQDPGSPSYHRWLTPAQFADRFGPSPATVSAVTGWLAGRGLHATRSSALAVTVRADASAVTAALGTPLERYRTRTGGQGFVASEAPLVPSGLQAAVSAVVGLDTLPVVRPYVVPVRPGAPRRAAAAPVPAATAPAATTPTACADASSVAGSYGWWTMSDLGRAYGIGSLQGRGLNGAGQTIAVYELAAHVPADVQTYAGCFGLTNTVTTVAVDGGPTSPADPGGTMEADLDIEQAATQAPAARIVSYEGPDAGTGPWDVWSRIVGDDTAKVVSTSWGACESDSGSDMSYLGPLFAQAAVQGQTVVAASGDSGSEECYRDYLAGAVTASTGTALDASYPGSDPDVTAVGGTDLTGSGTETVWNDCAGTTGTACAYNDGGQAAGGGGLSLYEPRVAGQPDAGSWATTPIPPTGTPTCNPCREVPDISANSGVPMVVYTTAFNSYGYAPWTGGIGTSFAAPMLAGLIADRNTGCAGGATGNLNTLLYGIRSAGLGPSAFRDITTGQNDMTNSNAGTYAAHAGFDLASGLGSPMGAGMACPEVESVSPATAPAGTEVTVTGLGLEGASVAFGATPARVVSSTATSAVVVVPAGSGTTRITATSVLGRGTASAGYTWGSLCSTKSGVALPGAAGIAAVAVDGCSGYLVVDSAGKVSAFGSATFYGDASGVRLAAPIIAISATPDGRGYRLLGADGGVFCFGDAHFYGSTGSMRLAAPVVGMAATPDGGGYWIVARDGGVFTFGDAHFHGSTGGMRLAAPVDGIAVAPHGDGYWLVAGDGGVFTFTPYGFYGSMGGKPLARPVVGMSSTPDGRGYTLVGADGGVFNFGDSPFYGSLGANPPASAVVDLSPAPANNGYYLVTADGQVYRFGPGTSFFGNA